MLRRPYLAIACLGVFLLGVLLLLDAQSPAGRPIIKISGVDTTSYYGVARSLLHDRDLDLANEYAVLKPIPGNRWTTTSPVTGRAGSPFPIGVSLAALPFLAIGAGVDALAGDPMDGYGRGSMFCFFAANLIYLCVGLAALVSLLAGLAPRSPGVAFAAALAIYPATTLAYYS